MGQKSKGIHVRGGRFPEHPPPKKIQRLGHDLPRSFGCPVYAAMSAAFAASRQIQPMRWLTVAYLFHPAPTNRSGTPPSPPLLQPPNDNWPHQY